MGESITSWPYHRAVAAALPRALWDASDRWSQVLAFMTLLGIVIPPVAAFSAQRVQNDWAWLALAFASIYAIIAFVRANYQVFSRLEKRAISAENEAERLKDTSQGTALSIGGNAVIGATFVDSPLTIGGTPNVEVANWMSERHLRQRSFRLYEIPRDQDAILRDRIFEECTIRGPAVMALVGKNEFVGGSVQGRIDGRADPVLWEVQEGPRFGAIGVENCSFRRCEFVGIGIAAPPDVIQKLREALEA